MKPANGMVLFLSFWSECLLFSLLASLYFLNFQYSCCLKYFFYIYLEHQTLIIFIFWGCYNKIPKTVWLINNKKFFLTLWRLEVQHQGTSMVRFWWRPSSRLQNVDFLLCPHTVEGVRELCEVSFTKALFPFTMAPPL